MPTYEYICENCGEAEEISTFGDHQPEPPTCQFCGGLTQRVFSATMHLWDGGCPSKPAGE